MIKLIIVVGHCLLHLKQLKHKRKFVVLTACTIYSIQALLSAPNPDDPLSENIAKHWKANEVEAVETGMP